MFFQPPDHPAGDAQAHRAELRVVHALSVVGEVVGVPGGLLAGFGTAAQGGDHLVDAALVELLAPLPGPAIADLAADPVDRPGCVEQVALGVQDVDGLEGVGEVLVDEVPDPRRAVAEDALPEAAGTAGPATSVCARRSIRRPR